MNIDNLMKPYKKECERLLGCDVLSECDRYGALTDQARRALAFIEGLYCGIILQSVDPEGGIQELTSSIMYWRQHWQHKLADWALPFRPEFMDEED